METVLGKQALATVELLNLLDEVLDDGDSDLLDLDGVSDGEDGFERLQTDLRRIRARTNPQQKLQGKVNNQVQSLHDSILRSIEMDERLRIFRELDVESSSNDLESAFALLFSLVMEPSLGEEHGGSDVVQGRTRRKTYKVRQPYTVTCALKQTNWFEKSFDWENDQFRAFYRMSKTTFWELVRILEANSVFHSTGYKQQRAVSYQLGVFLLRYGSPGANARYPMMLTSVGEGTVLLYCRRVIRAIREFGLTCVGWPTAERKAAIKAGFKKKCGLDNIIGAVDGTLLDLANKPRIDGDSYVSRKGGLAVTVQVTTDHEGRVTSFQCGFPGSKNDAYVWKHSTVYRKRARLFAPGEFLLADGGYPLSPYLLIPFNRSEQETDGHRKRMFNTRISSARVVIERTFGRLKARFPSLHRLGAVEDMLDLHRAVEAMFVLHNICYDLHDRADSFLDEFTQSRIDGGEEIYDYVQQELDMPSSDREDEALEDRNLLAEGRRFRNQYLQILCLV